MFESHLNARRLTLLDRLEHGVAFLTWAKLDREPCSTRRRVNNLEVVDLQFEVGFEGHPLLAVFEEEAGAISAIEELEVCLRVTKEVGL